MMWPLGLNVISDAVFTSAEVTGLNKVCYIRQSVHITKAKLKETLHRELATGVGGVGMRETVT